MLKRSVILACIAYASLSVVALDIITGGANLPRHVSDYALGQYRFVAASAFFSLAFGSILLASMLLRSSKDIGERTGAWLLGIWGALLILAGLFHTGEGSIHDHAANSAFFIITLSIGLFATSLKSRALAYLAGAAAVLYLVLYEFARGTQAVGYMQRAFLVSVILALAYVSLSLKKPSK